MCVGVGNLVRINLQTAPQFCNPTGMFIHCPNTHRDFKKIEVSFNSCGEASPYNLPLPPTIAISPLNYNCCVPPHLPTA